MTAAVLERLNAPLVLRELSMPESGIGQVQVRITTTGICGAQLQEIRGEKGNTKYMPHLLGHEACAIVERIGPGVSTVKEGDKVVCHWRKGDGIEADGGFYGQVFKSTLGLTMSVNYGGGPIHTFCTQAIISENRCTAVPQDTPDELCALLGCGLSTALGVVENEAKVMIGESVLVVGCGGVGLNVIRAAKMRGAGRISAFGIGSHSRSIESGADEFIITMGSSRKFDCIIDTTGSSESIANTIQLLAPSGRYILVGQPAPEASIVLHSARHLFDGTGKTIKATQGGCFNPAKDIPRYVAAWRSGALKIDGIVTHRVSLADINQGIEILRSGSAGRVMVDMSL